MKALLLQERHLTPTNNFIPTEILLTKSFNYTQYIQWMMHITPTTLWLALGHLTHILQDCCEGIHLIFLVSPKQPWRMWIIYMNYQELYWNHNTIKQNKANLRDLIAATGLVILLKLDSNRQFFRPCDLEIWWMTSKNNRAPLLYYIKLCA